MSHASESRKLTGDTVEPILMATSPAIADMFSFVPRNYESYIFFFKNDLYSKNASLIRTLFCSRFSSLSVLERFNCKLCNPKNSRPTKNGLSLLINYCYVHVPPNANAIKLRDFKMRTLRL